MVMETKDLSAHGDDYEGCAKFLSRDFVEQEWVFLNLEYYRSCSPRGRGLVQIWRREKTDEEIIPCLSALV